MAAAPLVLVVDDYVDSREMFCELLGMAGYRVEEAGDGAEAVDKASTLLPDLVLMDLSLPVLDGWEATRQLKDDPRTRHIPVVALTGHRLEGGAQEASALGYQGVLSKPCTPDALLSEVRRQLGHAAAALRRA
jgi:CheY-like chemotaxis protein